MALDRAAQHSRDAGHVPPTLRLYRWARPTVTLGHFQDESDVDRPACRRYGVDIAVRPTGGRGVLHDDELTYSVIAAEEDGVPRGVAASYRYLSAALARAYSALGIEAEMTSHDRASAPSAACYLATTRADLSLGASKLSGSAQVWKGSTVLQHGSFTRSRDIGRESAVFGLSSEESELLTSQAVTMDRVLAEVPSFESIARAVVDAFATEFGITFVEDEWTSLEASLAGRFVTEQKDQGSGRR